MFKLIRFNEDGSPIMFKLIRFNEDGSPIMFKLIRFNEDGSPKTLLAFLESQNSDLLFKFR